MKELLAKYFPELSPEQVEKFEKLKSLYPEWNEKINVISRKDIENLDVHHILHSLGIAKFIKFAPGTEVMDLGTGGGLPGIPLAIMFPEVKFHLIDRIGKKIKVAQEIAKELGLKNVTFQHGDSGECRDKFDFVVSRAVMPQSDLLKAVKGKIKKGGINPVPNGLIALKGGELGGELQGLEKVTEVVDLSQYFDEDFFKTKKLVYTLV